MGSVRFSTYIIMSFAKADIMASFPNRIRLFSFSCLITAARTSSTILGKSRGNGHPCLVHDLKGKVSGFYPLSIIAMGFLYTTITNLKFPFILILLKVFF